MSPSVLVQCPHCNAQGNLADPALFGQAISCPVCQQTFVAPTPADQAPPAPAAGDPPPPAPVAVAATEPMAAVPPTPDMTASEPPATSPVAAEWPPQPAETVGAVSIAAPRVAEAVAEETAATGVPAVIDPAVFDPAVVAADPVAEVLVPAVPAVAVAPVLAGEAEVVNPSAAEVGCSAPTPQPMTAPAMPTAVTVAVPVAAVSMLLPQTDAPGAAPIAPPPAAGMWSVGPAPSEIDFPVTGDFLVPERPAMEGPTPDFMAPLPPLRRCGARLRRESSRACRPRCGEAAQAPVENANEGRRGERHRDRVVRHGHVPDGRSDARPEAQTQGAGRRESDCRQDTTG